MASGIIGNDVPRKGLRVRVPCPPLDFLRFLRVRPSKFSGAQKFFGGLGDSHKDAKTQRESPEGAW